MREINLLPPSRRRAIRRRAADVALTHFLSTAALAVSVMTAAGFASWLVMWGMSLSITPATTNDLETAVAEYKELRQTVVRRSEAVNRLITVAENRIVWSETIGLLLTSVPANTTIKDLKAELTRSSDNEARAAITITGRTSNRATLTLFEERLQQLPQAQTVQSPPTNLLERINVPYQLTVVLQPPQL